MKKYNKEYQEIFSNLILGIKYDTIVLTRIQMNNRLKKESKLKDHPH